MMNLTKIRGWGNYPQQKAQLLTPTSLTLLSSIVKKEKTSIARGMGRSYGDSANATKVIQTLLCDHFIEFDEVSGMLTAEAGISFREILRVIVPSIAS